MIRLREDDKINQNTNKILSSSRIIIKEGFYNEC